MLTVDVDRLRDNLIKCEEVEEGFYATEGEQYLRETILPKCMYGIFLPVGDIDFDAFSEDDIVDLIDCGCEQMEENKYITADIIENFKKSKAQSSKIKKFF
ncbi:MAG: hypothetical protein K5768_10375 [Firmicutes bacterium]|nr:hypothetical protein [Bacillota bacterium]